VSNSPVAIKRGMTRIKEALKFEKRSRSFWIAFGTALILLLGVLDYRTGPEIASSLFYLLPICLATWFAGKRPGEVLAFLSALVWLAADITARQQLSSPLLHAWNATVRLAIFLLVVLLLANLKKELRHTQELARTDFLTGTVNSRYFYELAQMELNRAQRYKRPFTIAYLDVDNFKVINDNLGHSAGDMVLQAVARCVRASLRQTDVIARIGGDEFVLLLPETEEPGARSTIAKIQPCLMEEMRKNKWPVTFSIGVMTYVSPPPTVDDMIKMSDELMYTVKNQCKNAVAYSFYPS